MHTVDTLAGTDLVFPLSRHDFSIGTRNLNTSVHAGLVVCLNDITAVDTTSTDTAVVRTLRARETTLGPAVWPAVGAQEGVFLLQTEPDFVMAVGFHQSCGFMAIVEFVGSAIGVPGLAHDENVLTQTDWIGVNGNRSDVDIGIVTRGLTG